MHDEIIRYMENKIIFKKDCKKDSIKHYLTTNELVG
jgi:hypothetical protein